MTTRPLRLAHLADTHLGYRALGRADPESGRNQRAVDVERAFAAAVDRILQSNVDLVVHAGDVFHHTRPSWATLRCFVREMRRLEDAGLPCLVIGGNHDTPRLRTTGSVFGLLELALPRVRFATAYDTDAWRLDDLNLTVHAVPHGALVNPNPPVALPEPDRRNILVTHGLAPGVKLRGQHEPGEETLSGGLLGAGFDYVALGHYHLWGAQGHNAWYSGSTERTGWGDIDANPGYLLVTLGAPGAEPSVEHRPIPTRPMRHLPPLSGEGRTAREIADAVLGKAQALGLPDAMVRVRLDDTPRPVRREAESILRREAAEVVWSVEVRTPTEGILTVFGDHPSDGAVPDLRALFGTFVDEEVAPRRDAAFVAAFRERGGNALADAIAQAEAVATTEDAAS
jgi:DNA repair exonuclease SbcCD nuclease subunit